jgi:hypothetical protein
MKLSLANWRTPHLPAVSKLMNGAVSLGGRAVGGVWRWLSPPARRRVLRPYTRPLGALRGAPLIVVLLLFCFIWGAAFAILAPYLVLPLLVPPVVLGLIVLWALPETDRPPVRALGWLFTAFFLALVLWPSYLAFSIPGIPRLSLQRIFGIPLAIVLLVCISTSITFRARLGEVLRSGPWFSGLLFTFLAIQLVSISFSSTKGASIEIYLGIVLGWITTFFAGCYLLSRPGRPTKFAIAIAITAVVLSALSLLEFVMHRVPWAGHIPSFLKVDDPNVEGILAGTERGGKGHRVQGPFHTALALSEYLALCVPFLLYFAMENFPKILRIGAGLMVPVVVMMTVFTQSRTGLLGILVSFLLFPVFRVVLFWVRNPKNMFAATAVFMSPLGVVAGLGIALLVPGIRFRILGGGVERLSNQGRTEQIHMGIPKIITHPWGYGVGRSGEILGYLNSAGQPTIDSYPLRLALEYGVDGLFVYYAMNIVMILIIIKELLFASVSRREDKLLMPVVVGILSFNAMQINFAVEDNQPVAFVLYAVALALLYLRKQSKASVLDA